MLHITPPGVSGAGNAGFQESSGLVPSASTDWRVDHELAMNKIFQRGIPRLEKEKGPVSTILQNQVYLWDCLEVG